MERKGRPRLEGNLGYIKPEYVKPRKGVVEKQFKQVRQERLEAALTMMYYLANDTERIARGDKKYITKLAEELLELI